MMGLPVTPPYAVFTGLDGTPVEDGFVYFGAVNQDPQTNPIVVYWDSVMTEVAAQPLRTLDGYISRNGTPANIYVPGDYSVTVRDKNNNLIFTARSASQIAWAQYAASLAANVYSGSGGSAQIGFIQSGTGAVARTAQAKMREYVTVEDFGAVGDGVTDDTAAIQLAINYVQASNSNQMELHFDAKPYRCLNTLQISGPVQMVGQGFFDFDRTRPITRPEKGTWLIHANSTDPLIRVSNNAGSCSGLTNIAIFQEGHPAPGPGWIPATRDWVIRNEGSEGTFKLDRVHFHGVYRGVLTDNSARPHYENITGQFFSRGFTFDRIFDLGKLDGIHAWTYWSEQDDVLQWQQANSETISLGRVDGLWLDRIFSFAVDKTIYIYTSPFGGTARVIYVNSMYSDYTGRGIVVDSTAPAYISVGNFFHLGQEWPPASPPNVLSGACGIGVVQGSNHIVQVANAFFTLAESSCIKVEGTNNQVYVASIIADQYDRAGTGAGAFFATATNIVNIGSQTTLSKYGGGATHEISTGSGGTVTIPTKEVITQTVVNRPVTAGNIAGQLATYTVEGEANAGLAVVAKNAGTVSIGSSTNLLGFYGSAATAKQVGVAVTAAGIHAALVNLGLIAP